MERKLVQVSDVRGIDAVDGIAEAIVSVTNIVDSVNDIIMPGAYKGTLKRRNPKGVWSHDTNIPIAKTLQVEELMPGDPRLPQDLILKNAGALLVRMQFNLNTSRGRDAFHDVQFFGPEQEWSIGYAVTEGKSETGKDGIRRIKELELYEYSPVIFGAAPHTRTLSIKEDEFDEKDMHTDSPGGTPPSFGTPQRVAAQQRHPSQGRKRPAIKAEVIQEEMQDQSEETSTMSEYGRRGLSDRQIEMADYYNEVVIDFGKFDQSSGANGAHYAEENPFAEQGLICANCVFFEGGGNCHLVDGKIKPNAICKLWVIDETLLTETATAEAKSEELIETKADAGGPIAGHTTPVSDRGHLTRQAILSVRSPGDKSYYRKIFAYHYPGTDGTRKTHYGFIHHHVDRDGNPGAANLVELAAEMTVLNGGRGGTKLRGEDRQKVYNHLARHYRDGGKTPPELKSDPELDNIMIKNGFISEPLTPKEQEHG